MPLLVDGYNLMHAMQSAAAWPEAVGRSMLCRLLGEWAAPRGVAVTVVFDGAAPPDSLAAQLADSRIEVLYSAPRTADAVMAEWLTRNSAPRRVMVVSSDHEVQRAARRRQAAFEKSEDFSKRLARELANQAERPNPRPEKTPAPPIEGEGWLLEFGFDPNAEEPFEHP